MTSPTIGWGEPLSGSVSGKEVAVHFMGVDLHKRFLVVAKEDDRGRSRKPRRFECSDLDGIAKFFDSARPFKAVIESSSSYRWLYDLLSPMGEVILAHPLRLRAIVAGRAKTDKLDAALLAKLLRAGLIPTSYVPPRPYQDLREITRARARLSRRKTEAKNELHAILARRNVRSPYVNAFCKSGVRWLARLELPAADRIVRDELLKRIAHFDQELLAVDQTLKNDEGEIPRGGGLDGSEGYRPIFRPSRGRRDWRTVAFLKQTEGRRLRRFDLARPTVR